MDKLQIEAILKEKTVLANKLFNLEMPVPIVSYMNRKRVAGTAWPSKHLIEFNETLAKHNPDKFHETIIHELSHLVHRKLYPNDKTAHNARFYHIDKMLGGRGTRCHSYDISVIGKTRTMTKYVVVCPCNKEHKVSKKILDTLSNRYCTNCKGSLTFTGKVLKVTK